MCLLGFSTRSLAVTSRKILKGPAGSGIIQCSYDTTLNAKTVVIDKEIVIIGSANWSDGGLNKNLESNSLVISKDIAESVLSNLQTLESPITPE